MLEGKYKTELIKKIKKLLPGCVVLKNDAEYLQGIPDLVILYKDTWAMIEVKASRRSLVQPNQVHYITKLDEMSFAAIIYPENEEDILNDLQYALRSRRPTRFPKRK